jgi:2-dehydro-3-deoxygluconokinase
MHGAVMARVVTFGEIMLRLSPPGTERFFQAPLLSATFGGGEANVAVSLAHFGIESVYVTRVPRNPIGEGALRSLCAEGVDVRHVLRGGERLGIYFAEAGASQRPSMVVYDRAGAAIAAVVPGTFDWRAIMAGASWFHVTGITPALGSRVAAATVEALEAARAAGATVSLDLNFRRKLWSESQAQATMRPMMPLVDLVIANEEDLQSVLGFAVPGADAVAGRVEPAAYEPVARRVSQELGPSRVAITLRESHSASDNGWSAVLWDSASGTFTHSQQYEMRVIDRIGGGDSFAAGLIYALLSGRTPDVALRFAVAASALKHTIPGDFNRVTVDEVDRLAVGDASGRVQR